MGQKSYEVFQAVENKANLLAGYWGDFKTEIIQHLPESYHGEIHELSSNLEKALEVLINELRHPTLILATTGTTSSGKSTLVNFLCGADIVPTAVSEMSAGAVTIEYNQEKGLIIEKTPGALWKCGEWKNISDEEIYDLLYDAMSSYIDAREEQPNLACPQANIYYPFRLVKDESLLELPKGVRVKLLDLPGLSYVGDERNLAIIKQCREALCLVTYNSEETDPYKVDNLLSEVVDQVKDLGGSPARMLFILNKIDVFRKDQRWPRSEQRFIEKTTKNIKLELTKQLREYNEEIENLTILKLSTWPALLALQIQENKELVEDILEELPTIKDKWSEHDQSRINQLLRPHEQAIDHFQFLIKNAIRKGELDNDPKKWTVSQQQLIAKELFKQSYAEEFEDKLSKHIAEHFPKLVIPQAIEKFNVAAGNSIAQWAVQTTTAILNSSEENYQQESELLSQTKENLDSFLQASNAKLRQPLAVFEKLDIDTKTADNLVASLREAINELQFTPPYDQIQEKLVPLVEWREALKTVIRNVLEAVVKSLDNGRVDLDNINFKKAHVNQVNMLKNNLDILIQLGYRGSDARNGLLITAKRDKEKLNLQIIKKELNNLSINLTIILSQILKRVSAQEINRIEESVSELFRFHIKHIEKGAEEKAPNFVIKFPQSELNTLTRKLEFDFNLESDIEISSGTYRSFKHWLWMKKKESMIAEIPSPETLLQNWIHQFQQQGEPEMLCLMFEWLLEQIDDLKKNVDHKTNDIFNSYLTSLEKAQQEITTNYEETQIIWKPIQERAKFLEQNLAELENFEKEDVN
ncbi:MAG: GTPase [Microcystis aeruginosa K13-05]|jgi:GTPase Era involved in 16S rRNA processing|uniref:dynamin family protein n=1 Tax=unclassified Microcystis TaxID=2643300 RepID=UPI0022C87851|nr:MULTISPECIES: dynamin family protein [unclassified Microcystis]MCZ8045326.1 dynamin family protein [Microcystis sp. LE19-41.2A]MCZ8290188.1 dynamin family protein [Microcystis sp. LE19-59.1C]NCR78452.1 GTPase [Microcystis aeruginosa K13-10]NCR83150.1 GTPase [Microcystis aeruginosa K13-05]